MASTGEEKIDIIQNVENKTFNNLKQLTQDYNVHSVYQVYFGFRQTSKIVIIIECDYFRVLKQLA
jgi:hypothetical protein